MIPDQGDKFSIPDHISYLNCAYTAPLMKSAQAAGERAVRAKNHPWQVTPAHFFSTLDRARDLFADLMKTQSRNIAVIPSVSYGIALAARNIPLSSGQQILVLEDQFPSNIYSWQRMAREKNGRVRTIKRPDNYDWTPGVIEGITDRTAIVALPHCHWTDGSVLDLDSIGQACREFNAALVIDGTQSLGAMPFDISSIQPDFLVTTAHKWLLGPYGYGFCYVAPKWQEGVPLEENWMNREGSQDFSRLVDYKDRYQQGARRYDFGEASSFFLAPVAAAALTQLLEWGGKEIALTLKHRIDRIAEKASEFGFKVPPQGVRAPHFLGMTLPGGLPGDLASQLIASDIYVSIRGDAIRVAPHLYTRDKDVDLLFSRLKSMGGSA